MNRPKPPTIHDPDNHRWYLDYNRYFNETEKYMDLREAEIRKTVEDSKVSVLEMFAYQGPPSKNWLKTEGRFWEGWNKALDKVLESIEETKKRTS